MTETQTSPAVIETPRASTGASTQLGANKDYPMPPQYNLLGVVVGAVVGLTDEAGTSWVGRPQSECLVPSV